MMNIDADESLKSEKAYESSTSGPCGVTACIASVCEHMYECLTLLTTNLNLDGLYHECVNVFIDERM